ncbi:unnamed protein product [Linum tenue]|uniref:Uncharacterized protein n=1 Tax=Linum tenue TaxID=586396 RepID=A0AAV0L2L2_9ROSI|nr:unnamed protein product [Linum tenue]
MFWTGPSLMICFPNLLKLSRQVDF